MASLVICDEKWACINGSDELRGVEVVSEINNAFLMSLMEELQDHVEERDEERLNSVIRSLEAEINSCKSNIDQDLCMDQLDDHDQPTSDREDIMCDQSFNLEQMDGHDLSVSFDDLDMNGWINMKEEPWSLSHETSYYHVYH